MDGPPAHTVLTQSACPLPPRRAAPAGRSIDLYYGQAPTAMPYLANRACSTPGCPGLTARGKCPACRAKANSERVGPKLYDSRWRTARRLFLDQPCICGGAEGCGQCHGSGLANRFCVHCWRDAQLLAAAEEVDHVRPHRGDPVLFWDTSNWQPLCRTHHSRKTVAVDGGFGRVRL